MSKAKQQPQLPNIIARMKDGSPVAQELIVHIKVGTDFKTMEANISGNWLDTQERLLEALEEAVTQIGRQIQAGQRV